MASGRLARPSVTYLGSGLPLVAVRVLQDLEVTVHVLGSLLPLVLQQRFLDKTQTSTCCLGKILLLFSSGCYD